MKLYCYYLIILLLFACNTNFDYTTNENEIKSNTANTLHSSSDNNRTLSKLTNMEFITKIIDFGNIHYSDTLVTGHYLFKNTGNSPLLIEYVNPECSCTSFKFTEQEILPGGEGYIDLTFNINGKIGSQKLYATVKANTEAKFYNLILKLNIID